MPLQRSSFGGGDFSRCRRAGRTKVFDTSVISCKRQIKWLQGNAGCFLCREGDDFPGLEEWETVLKGCTAGTRILDSIISSEDMKLYAAASKAVVRISEAKNPDRDYSEIRAVLNAARLQERGEQR